MEFRVPAMTGNILPDGAALEVLGNAEVTEAPVNGVLAEELVEETTINTKVSV